MGAVSGDRFLRLDPPASRSPFEVERFRREPVRNLEFPDVVRPTLVLGSTQPVELVRRTALRERGVDLARRRGGGGVVYLEPGAQLWVDAWIPRDDPLWEHDVAVAAEWVGTWWVHALSGLGVGGLEVHTGRSVPGELGDMVCFAGRGPGEVFARERKVVGLSQWRAREGALFSSSAYLRWDPGPLSVLLDVDAPTRSEFGSVLPGVAVGLRELEPAVPDLGAVRARLTESFETFGT